MELNWIEVLLLSMRIIKSRTLLVILITLSLVSVLTACKSDSKSIEDEYVVEIVDYLLEMSAFPDDLSISYITLAKDDDNDLYYYEVFFTGKTLNYENLDAPGVYYENSMLYIVNIINTQQRNIIMSQDYEKYPDVYNSYMDLISIVDEVEYYAEDIASIVNASRD